MSSIKGVIELEDVRTIANRAFDNESVEVIDYRLVNYSNDNIGFLGSHQTLEITVKASDKSSDELVKRTFFVKSMPRESDVQKAFVKQQQVFNHESEFFNELMPQLLEAVTVGDVEQWAPKCYFANDDLIVLEDLRNTGYSMTGTKILKLETLKAAVRPMARLHASSILAEKKLGKSLNELYPKACVEVIFHKDIWKYVHILSSALVKEVGVKNGISSRGLEEAKNQAFLYMNNEKSKHRVICHGDAWPNNVLLDNSVPPKCLLVDYQLVRYAERMFDVAHFLYLSTTRERREKEEKEVIEAYWDELCQTLRKCDPELERPSLEDLVEEYEKARLSAQMIALIYYPSVLLSKDVYAEHDGKLEEVLRKFVFRQNNDCILEQMEKDPEYGSRITELVLEFLKSCSTL